MARSLRRQVRERAGNRCEYCRLPQQLTVLAMTGVTAMVRMTADQMDRLGAAWPAEVVGPELASADITAISNEVPFVPGCETNTSPDNLVFCSKPEYMETLTASGADIIGLTGNHQNDYGRSDALTSLEIYAEAGLPAMNNPSWFGLGAPAGPPAPILDKLNQAVRKLLAEPDVIAPPGP